MQLSTTHYGNSGNIWWSYQVSTGRIFTDFKGLTFSQCIDDYSNRNSNYFRYKISVSISENSMCYEPENS
jgi:hypothetical protein